MAVLLLALPARGDLLDHKAQLFREALFARHFSRENLVLYRVGLESLDEIFGEGLYPNLADTPTFNGQLAAGACTRAGWAKGKEREEALHDARRALEGLRFLMDITGERGLLARGVRHRAEPDRETLRGRRFSGKGEFAGYVFRADPSMDQYANGLVPAIGVCRRYFPEETRKLAVDAADHLLRHDFFLTDPDGKRTRYGDLSWRSGFGLNSIAQLTGYAIFALAAQLDPDPRWPIQQAELRDRYRVVARGRVTNLDFLGWTNESNDLMAMSLYRALIPLARETGDPALPDLRHGLYKTWHRVQRSEHAYFTLIFCALEPQACKTSDLQQARDQLERFPLDKRDTPRGLEAHPRSWLPGRWLEGSSRRPVPIEQRSVSSFEWKSSPFRMDRENDPDTEYTGLDYLVAYWLYQAVSSAQPLD